MLSLETIKRGVIRAVWAGLAGSISAFVLLPVNLQEPKQYLYALSFGMATGFLMGLQKFVSGYVKYDK